MSGIVDPSTPEREAREALRDYIVNPHKSHGQGCGVYALTRRECSCYMSAAGERRLDAYAAAVRARALADVAGWVEGMRVAHTAECVKAAEEFLYEPLDRVCSCFATAHNQALDALLAKLREAK